MNLTLNRFALSLAFSLLFNCSPAPRLLLAQSRNPGRVQLTVTIKDKDQDVRLVQNFGLLVQKLGDISSDSVVSSIQVSTSSEGTASIALLPGNYVVKSQSPLVMDGVAYEWSLPLTVGLGKLSVLELSSDNATVTQALTALRQGRITNESDLLSILGGGVVTVEGELWHGTGFIVDERGLILTNQHTISDSKELRVQFDRERKVQAELLAEDRDKDLAVLWVSLEPCPDCKPLTLEKQKADQGSPAAGERVFTIASPLAQSKRLTPGVIRRDDTQAIISDISINPDSSGGPLFNMRGEVIAINCFSDQGPGGSSTSRNVRVGDARDLLEKAKAVLASAPAKPPSQLIPVEPIDFYPTEELKSRVDVKKFDDRPYKTEAGKYQITMLTPALKYYIIEKDRIELARRQAKKKNEINLGPEGKPVDSFYNLRNWAEYVSQMRPVVHILAIPEVKATGKSLFFGALMAGVGAMGGSPVFSPLDFKFKADFEEMLLTCDGKPITPIQRGKIEYVAPMQSYLKIKTRSAYAGIYTYSADSFQPGRCKQLELQVISDENPTAPEKRIIEPSSVQKVWSDFDAYHPPMTRR